MLDRGLHMGLARVSEAMDLSYAITPFVAWLIAGVIKFIINSSKEKRLAFDLIGYGGLPSNHSTIVTSIAALIAIREGITNPVFGIAVTLAFIVMLDANSLRKQIGRQARIINQLADNETAPLRERMGHSRLEILAGVVTGIFSAWLVHQVSLVV